MEKLLGFVEAIRFLTIIPIPFIKRRAELSKSLPFFPIIGLVLGAISVLIYYLFSFLFPSNITVVLVIITLVILTGANHVDGFIDTFDALVAGKTTEQRLDIMSDTKVGSFGIVSVVLLFLLKFVSLASTPLIFPTLLSMPALSRWIVTSAIYIFPNARNSGMGFVMKQGASWQKFMISTVISIIISVLLFSWKGLILIAALWFLSSSILVLFRSRFHGLTGDNYGAIIETSEILVVLLIIIIGRFLE